VSVAHHLQCLPQTRRDGKPHSSTITKVR
jgi:hypothetical protein